MLINKKYSFNKLLKILANLQLAITLLFIIGIAVAIGTFIEQDQSIAFYKENYPVETPFFGFIDWEFILRFNIDNVYTAFWFFSLLFFFALTLLACTFTTQLPALKNFRLWNFISTSTQLKRFTLRSKSEQNIYNKFSYLLHNDKYHIFCQGKKKYAYSGLLGRVGPIIVHFSILLLLLGTSAGSLSGYSIQELVPRGEIFHLQNLVKSGDLSRILQNVSWRINDFWITYSADSKIDQFYSDISLIDSNGEELKRKTIFVNEPFPYKGVTIYQTDWDILGVKIYENKTKLNKQIPVKKITKENRNFWVGSVSLNPSNNEKITFLINSLNKEILLYNENGAFLEKATLGNNVEVNNSSLRFEELITSTGLQIKEDPGVKIVYLSFLIIMVSIYISFLSYSQIWTLQEANKFFVAGKTNRAILNFQEDFKTRLQKSKYIG